MSGKTGRAEPYQQQESTLGDAQGCEEETGVARRPHPTTQKKRKKEEEEEEEEKLCRH